MISYNILSLEEREKIERLKNIHLGGIDFLVFPELRQSHQTRYDHSIGVTTLIKTLKGNIKEQIAALLHDISHTAFSHLIDHIHENDQENFHEKYFENFILKSETSEI